jgi:hypothetical protein
VHLDDIGARDLIRVPTEQDGHVEAARPDRDHSQAACLNCMRVGSEHHLPRLAEPLWLIALPGREKCSPYFRAST